MPAKSVTPQWVRRHPLDVRCRAVAPSSSRMIRSRPRPRTPAALCRRTGRQPSRPPDRRRQQLASAHSSTAGLPDHVAQAIRIVRRRRPLNGKNSKKWSTEIVHAITSLTAADKLQQYGSIFAIVVGVSLLVGGLYFTSERPLSKSLTF